MSPTAPRRLNVVALPAWYPTPDQPVSGIFARGQAFAIQLRNNVVVIADSGGNDNIAGLTSLERADENGLDVVRVSYRPTRPLDAAGYLLGVARVLSDLRREGRRTDIIHAHIHRAGWAAVLVGRVFRIPVVITENSTEFGRKTLSRGGRRRAAIAFRRADLVCPVSHDLQRQIEGYGMRGRFEVVPNQVDTDMFMPASRPAAAPFRVVNVAMQDPKKGLLTLLLAVAALSRNLDVCLDLVGDGPQRAELQARTAELGLAERVTFHGVLKPEDIAQLLRQAHVFVLPSLAENLPLALMEAQATGLPVVATTVGGVPEMVSPDSGRLVPPGDANALRDAMHEVLTRLDDYDRDSIAEAARDRWSYDAIARRWDEVYRAVLRRRGRDPGPPPNA
jgi:glycosyltransferase involved in cell wall biosynthesis